MIRSSLARTLPLIGLSFALGAGVLTGAGCKEPEKKYEAKKSPDAAKAKLPAVPNLPQKPKKSADNNWTVYGATHDLRSRKHNPDIENKEITFVGYIVKVNYDDAPDCAIHEPGKEDPADCKAPKPRFWLADEKGETKNIIQVANWATNFAKIYGLIETIDKAAEGKEDEDAAKYVEEERGKAALIMHPLPNVGAKVKVTGVYGRMSHATGIQDPKFGVISVSSIEYLEPPTEPVVLRGMKLKKKKKEEKK